MTTTWMVMVGQATNLRMMAMARGATKSNNGSWICCRRVLKNSVLLYYSDCCVDTYFPDNFCSCQPVSNHNTHTSYVHCSFAHMKSVQLFLYPHEVVFVFLYHVPSLDFFSF